MAKYEVVQSIPKTYLKTLIAEGSLSSCFLTSDGDVYKQFKTRCTNDEDLNGLSEAESPSFAFPTCITYLGVKSPVTIDGYRMDLVQGKYFNELPKDTKMEDLVNASRIVEDESIRLARENGIVLYDVNRGNVLFQRNKTFRAFDTDLFYRFPNEDPYDNIKDSLREWNEYMLYNLDSALGIFQSDRLNLIHEYAIQGGKYRASEVIEEIMTEIRNQARIEPDTLENYNMGLERIKRI